MKQHRKHRCESSVYCTWRNKHQSRTRVVHLPSVVIQFQDLRMYLLTRSSVSNRSSRAFKVELCWCLMILIQIKSVNINKMLLLEVIVMSSMMYSKNTKVAGVA
ncbi:unnamed protein product [Amoebophrya sp. A25]|nr:unnamed protein product [Amoebophrya sp. A25]|eukprot:GSA25T00000687001.1